MTIYLLLWARIPYKKWSSPRIQPKSPKCSTWVHSQKRQKDMTPKDERPPAPLRSEGVQYATGEEWRAITNGSRKKEVAGPKWK